MVGVRKNKINPQAWPGKSQEQNRVRTHKAGEAWQGSHSKITIHKRCLVFRYLCCIETAILIPEYSIITYYHIYLSFSVIPKLYLGDAGSGYGSVWLKYGYPGKGYGKRSIAFCTLKQFHVFVRIVDLL